MRYIDAEALTDSMLEHYNELCEKYGDYDHYTTGYGDAIDAIENAPTVDVVPRSEVEKIIGKFECLLCHVTGGRLSKYTYDLRTMETVATDCINETYNDGFAEGHKECAREIFEEIEKIIDSHEITIGLIYDEGYGATVAIGRIDKKIAELKKKYTEGADE